MSDCCTSSCESKPKTLKCKCPACNQVALDVSTRTMLQHIKNVWQWDYINGDLSDEQYYFCGTEDCELVYFTENGETLSKADIRTRIGIKEQDDSALICYCFGVNKAVAASDKEAKTFVVKQTRESTCACETANPSGRCCLKDFLRFKE